jgi:very-short-patch-repair endonuclease
MDPERGLKTSQSEGPADSAGKLSTGCVENLPRRVMTVGGWEVLTLSGGPDARVAQIAAAQRGLATRAQLRLAGLTDSQIDGRLRRGQLRRIHQGVLTVSSGATPDWFAETAALLACGPLAVLSHLTALRAWALPAADRGGGHEQIAITVQRGDRRRSHTGITVHRTTNLPDRQVRRIQGLRVTDPARTLADVAPRLTPRQLERVLDEALARRLTSFARLQEAIVARRATANLARLVAARDGTGARTVTESEAEERFLQLIREAGLPEPLWQVELHGYRVDAYWPEARFAVEIDGFQWHSGRRHFERDRLKDRTLADHGIQTTRITWDQIAHQALQLAAHISRQIAIRSAA